MSCCRGAVSPPLATDTTSKFAAASPLRGRPSAAPLTETIRRTSCAVAWTAALTTTRAIGSAVPDSVSSVETPMELWAAHSAYFLSARRRDHRPRFQGLPRIWIAHHEPGFSPAACETELFAT